MSKIEAVNAIRKKLKGQELSARDIYGLMDEIANKRLGPILTTYFAAAGFSQGFTNEELYLLTKAMVETGERLLFDGIVADKHSIGGVAGTRTTMIIVPIIASCGIKIPKVSSRAITSAAGTADTMEVLAKVSFRPDKLVKIVEKTNGCIVWGGHLGIAPADDIIIQVEKPLAFESFDKIIVSVMAKKIAVGSTHIVIDIPIGPFMKVRHKKDAHIVAEKFQYIAERFGTKLVVEVIPTYEPAGYGVGPVLEVKDVLSVLQQDKDRPLKLEERALRLAGSLLDLCMRSGDNLPGELKNYQGKKGEDIAREMLENKKALEKLREIVKAQGGNPDFSQKTLKPGKEAFELKAKTGGKVRAIDDKEINAIARILGSPDDKRAGVRLNFKLGDKVGKNDILAVLFSSDKIKLREAVDSIKQLPMYYIES